MAEPRKATNSSMFDLKAELFRKQEEYKQLKAQKTSDFVKAVKTSKPGKGDRIWSQQNAGVLERASKDLAEQEEEDNVMDRSRRALEAKSKIYDNIASASGIPDEDGSEGFLVDFQRKAVDRIVEERRDQPGKTGSSASSTPVREGSIYTRAGDDSEEEDAASDAPLPSPANPHEEWVDYVDTFGRSRRCMKKDLPDLEKQERPLGRPLEDDSGLKLKEGATLLSSDMKRELRRQQWEKEAEESADGPVHYANVQYDENRSHGTGFYQFSKDSNLRDEQMEMLNKLREQTMDSRQRSERIKEKRKAALEARLTKVKQRRKIKDGVVLLGSHDKEAEEAGKEAEQKTPAEAPKEPEPLTRDDSWRQSAPVREWDIGKEKLPEWNAKRYMEQRRTDREDEFAPPQFYFDRKKNVPLVTSTRGYSAPSRDTGSQNGARHGRHSQPSSSAPPPIPSNTDAMLKQIRQSTGALPPHTDNKAGVDVASIPMPEMGSASENAGSSIRVKEEQKWEEGMAGEDSTREVSQQSRSAGSVLGSVQAPPPFQQVGYPHPHEQQPMVLGGPALDVSVPPPGYPAQPHMTGYQAGVDLPPPHQSGYPAQPHMTGHQAGVVLPPPNQSVPTPGYPAQPHMTGHQAGVVLPPPPHQSVPPPSFTATASQQGPLQFSHQGPSQFSQQGPSQFSQQGLSQFMYPSQQGLLRSQRQPKPALLPLTTPATAPAAQPPPQFKKPAAVAPASASKLSMVDRRFMQNREVSEEDLLGYMAPSSADPLAKIQAVSYSPGLFTASSQLPKPAGPSSQLPKPAGPSSQQDATAASAAGAAIESWAQAEATAKPAAAQTQGVIFGVPEFLQPATVTATSYQPGSFMAAKEAAAQRAEEAIEVARKKMQYSSAPVLYGRADDDLDPWAQGGGGAESGEKGSEEGKPSLTQSEGDETDEEFSKFMKQVKGGR